MTRYITLLLVALAATGLEAQTYGAALKMALADPGVRQVMMQQPEMASLRDDLLSAVKSLVRSQRHINNNYPSTHSVAQAGISPAPIGMATHSISALTEQPEPLTSMTRHAIEIRAPSLSNLF